MKINFDGVTDFSGQAPFSSADQQWYFRVTVPGSRVDDELDLSDRIQSLTITEERGAPMVATLNFADTRGTLNAILKYGKTVNIEWGIKERPGGIPYGNLNFNRDPDEMDKPPFRGPIAFFVINPECVMKGGFANGSISLRAGVLKSRKRLSRNFHSGTVRDMLRKICGELDFEPVLKSKSLVRKLSKQDGYRQQNETNLRFLQRVAGNERNPFTLWYGDDSRGKMHLFAFDYANEDQRSLAKTRGARSGWYHKLNYGGAFSPMLDGFKFGQNLNNQMGSTVVPTRDKDGKVSAITVRSPTETDHFWVLEVKKVEGALREAGRQSELAQLMKDVMAAGLDELVAEDGLYRRYFTKRAYTTAPEGIGWTGSGSVVPNPRYSVGEPLFVAVPNDTTIPDIYSHYTYKGVRQERRWVFHKIETTISAGEASQSVEIWN